MARSTRSFSGYDQATWTDVYAQQCRQSLLDLAENPSSFQLGLKNVLEGLDVGASPRIVEVGAATGVTSLILDDRFNKTLLDLNPTAIELAKWLYSEIGVWAEFVVADMFDMPLPSERFDVAFNAGVVEHLTRSDSLAMLSEMARITRPGGWVVVAFPNHFDLRYRIAYLSRLRSGVWGYPRERVIYSMGREIRAAGLVLRRRIVMDDATSEYYIDGHPRIAPAIRCASRVVGSRGYLTVLVMEKPSG